jgi:hypothetical protein
MARPKGYRRAFEKCQRVSDLEPPSRWRVCGVGKGFWINGIRCFIGLESESLPTKKHQ